MYNEIISAYARKPSNKYVLENPTIRYKEFNRLCGDDIEVFLRIHDTRIQEFSFIGNTALITTACAAIFGESIIQCPLHDILTMDYGTIRELVEVDISPRRHRAAVLGLLATRNAIHIYLEDGEKDDFSDVLPET